MKSLDKALIAADIIMERKAVGKAGHVQIIASNIDYALIEAHTTYGRIGVKVWICKGEVYGKRDLSPNVGMPNQSGGRGGAQGRGKRGGELPKRRRRN